MRRTWRHQRRLENTPDAMQATTILNLEGRLRNAPAAMQATTIVNLGEQPISNIVTCILLLHDCDRVVTQNSDGRLRVFAVVTGAFERELIVPGDFDVDVMLGVLATLGGNIIAAGNNYSGKVRTWDVVTGEQLDEISTGSDRILALVSLCDGRLAASAREGDILFYTHLSGHDLKEDACLSNAHNGYISDLASSGNLLATASCDKTVAVWDFSSYEQIARIDELSSEVYAVDINGRMVVVGLPHGRVRVYNVGTDRCKCIAAYQLSNSTWVFSVKIVGSSHILVTTGNIFILEIKSNTVLAQSSLKNISLATAILSDGSLAVCGTYRLAKLIAEPAEVADILKAHSEASISLEACDATSIMNALPPLQRAVSRVSAGNLSASTACRELIIGNACAVSLAEWWAAHQLLMRAVRDGDLASSTTFDDKRNWWFLNLYTHARLLPMGDRDLNVVQVCLEEAQRVGVIETMEGTLASIISRNDLEMETALLRSACEKMLVAITYLFIDQARLDRRLSELVKRFERQKRVQQLSQLIGVILGMIPLAGAATASAVAGTMSCWEGMDVTNAVESLLGAAVNPQLLAVDSLLYRFLYGGRMVLEEENLDQLSAEQRSVLNFALMQSGMTIFQLREIIAAAIGEETVLGISIEEGSTKQVVDVTKPGTLVQVEDESMSDANSAGTSSTATYHDHSHQQHAGDSENQPKLLIDQDDPSERVRNARTALASGEIQLSEFLACLRDVGAGRRVVASLLIVDLAPVVAARLTKYEDSPTQLARFEKMWYCLHTVFTDSDVSGEELANDLMTADAFWNMLKNGFESEGTCKATVGLSIIAKTFILELHGC